MSGRERSCSVGLAGSQGRRGREAYGEVEVVGFEACWVGWRQMIGGGSEQRREIWPGRGRGEGVRVYRMGLRVVVTVMISTCCE